MKRTFLATLLFLYPVIAFGATVKVDTTAIENAKNIQELVTAYQNATNAVFKEYENNTNVSKEDIENGQQQVTDNISAAQTSANETMASTKGMLTPEQANAQVQELQENADAMREKEQSLENRLVSGASMGAIGIGGMQIGSALAEQGADSAAEQDMAAYLATFRCNYGQGQNILGGTMNIEIPGANVLLPLYNEYVTLAADIKQRKEALGLAPGIESIEILDAATSGLYDNESLGITGGTYASVARALMNPTGADAQAWAAQKADTQQQLKTGAITAGVGALVGIAGDVLINRIGDKTEERSDEIIAIYDALRTLKQEVEQTPVTDKCPDNASGTYPHCKCNNTDTDIYSANDNTCTPCENTKVPDSNGTRCKCPDNMTEDETGDCITQTDIPKCKLTGKHIDIAECVCKDGYKENTSDNTCICPEEGHSVNEEQLCVKNKASDLTLSTEEFDISSDKLFDLNSYEIKDSKEIIKFAGAVENVLKNASDTPKKIFCIKIVGKTDTTGNDKINNPLSEKRASAVKNLLIKSSEILNDSNIYAYGIGSSECTPNNGESNKNCRVVTFQYIEKSCDDVKKSESAQ